MTTRESRCVGYLFSDRSHETIMTPEMFTAEQRALFGAVAAFTEKEVVPRRKEIEAKTPGLMAALLKKAGGIGALGLDIADEHGGSGTDKTTSMLMAESISREGGFAVSFGAHTGIGTLPIVFFGTDEQKQRYLPALATGEKLAAYALTEAGSGSDALAARATATLSADGKHWILNGQKQWITNAGFADVFIVFAKIDGTQFTGFIVERGMPGVSIGPEEHKLGIRGSSTCTLILENVPVPVQNVLGEPGRGHRIAFNVLNVGRLKLGVFAVGGVKSILRETLPYARERRQFGKALIEFPLIREKFATLLADLYALESMGYRATGAIDAYTAETGKGMEALEELNIESSILKVFGSELLGRAADEALQILGGYGYMEDYPLAKVYRDVRINRIFEGTNEINRMLVPGVLLKRAMKGQLPLMDAFQAASASVSLPEDVVDRATVQARTLALILTGRAAMQFMQGLEEEQEALAALADIHQAAFGLDSVRRRLVQADNQALHLPLARAYAIQEMDRLIARAGRFALDLGGAELHAELAPLLAPLPVSRTAALREVATRYVERGQYWLGAGTVA
ncbi:MAG: acyl-CoA dehydrogenase family protein [Deltaproteobacteria bacterium]|nr:acyl-CoA dehydrogenase family protein [Deltaproteobacteria bacterium]